ncbi:helix-turn-helix transcriptional regulator [Aeromonas eucrenophila]|uniref:Helix-turn-helix transcriptional regulator n=1 Tax=Aeromonas eucrenophila TaxID=649 RepID=A0ABW0YBM8_9GAMM|nr:WYL domain-containing protein [Aeromonas eucrenophila]
MEQQGKKHDLLVERLNEIFSAIYQGSEISKSWLCDHFRITERTAYRDLARLTHILDEVSPGKYRLSKALTPQLNVHDLANFASFTDVAHLFPNSNGHKLRDFMENGHHIAIRGHSSRDNSILSTNLQQLREAITQQAQISYIYKGKPRKAAPYKLTNQSGLWYMAAVEQDQLKSFEVGQIESLNVSDMPFYPEPSVLEQLASNSGISFGKKTLVTLHVSPTVAPYISRRDTFPEQKILSEAADGSLIITTAMIEKDQLFRWLLYWLPEIHIISPASVSNAFEQQLHDACKDYKNFASINPMKTKNTGS